MAVSDMLGGVRRLGSALPPGARSRLLGWGPAAALKGAVETRARARWLAALTGIAWHRIRDCPAAVLDAGGAQIGDRLYVICGMSSPRTVSRAIHVLDLRRARWICRHQVPDDLAHSHCGVATDGASFIYIAAGQLGPQCRPAVATVYCFDAATGAWHRLPPLPAPRYAGTLQLWRGRLHFVGGAAEDRITPTTDHWSLGVEGAVAREPAWRAEAPAPEAAMHRGACIAGDRLYLFGGQQGDFAPIPGDPDYTCTHRTRESYLASTWRLADPGGSWARLADMPIAGSHWDFSTLVTGERVLLFGGQVYKHPETFELRLTNAIQAYDAGGDAWSIAGYVPVHVKTPVTGCLDGSAVIACGQRGVGRGDRPGPIVAQAWQARLPPFPARASEPPLPALAGRRVLLVAHALHRTGAPLELLELAEAMIASGASVRLASMTESPDGADLAAAHRVPLVPAETAHAHAQQADVIVANTAASPTRDWLRACLAHHPELAARLVWQIHEIDVERYRDGTEDLGGVGLAVFGSRAALGAWRAAGCAPARAVAILPGIADATVEAARRPSQPYLPAAGSAAGAALGGAPRSLSRALVRARLGIRPGEVLVLAVGTNSAAKGHDMLVRTVAQTARTRGVPLRLLLVGFNDQEHRRDFLNRLTADERRVIGPRTAFVNTPYLAALYQASDLYVMNTQGRTGRGETFGRATVEAMAFGLPVLGTDAGGTPEIIRDGVDGYLYPLGEAGQPVLAERLVKLASEAGRRARMGAAGRDGVEARFRKRRYLREMNAALASVLPPA